MANTYTQVHIQTVFAVRNRHCLIHPSWEVKLHKYITGIIQNHDHKLLAINGMPDHIHIFFGMRPTQSLSELMQKVKGDSSKWINQQGWVANKFYWQAGFGAFSYAKSQIPQVIKYIRNQKEHHRKKSFREEYIKLLKDFDIDYDERYIFDSVIYT